MTDCNDIKYLINNYLIATDRQFTGKSTRWYSFANTGFSIQFSVVSSISPIVVIVFILTILDQTNPSSVLLGAPGLLDWRGSVVDVNIPCDNCRNVVRVWDPNERTKAILNRNILLGYSISSVRTTDGEYIFAGAPRDDDGVGAVSLTLFSLGHQMIIVHLIT